MELPLDRSRRAPLARMMLRNYPTDTWSRKAHIQVIVNNQNFIFIFTGDQGEQYGYSDSWTDDGIFFYTGEGQRGDMQFVRGNKAVRDHFRNGKEVYLFSYGRRRGWVRYVGQMVCSLICPFNASFVLLPQ